MSARIHGLLSAVPARGPSPWLDKALVFGASRQRGSQLPHPLPLGRVIQIGLKGSASRIFIQGLGKRFTITGHLHLAAPTNRSRPTTSLQRAPGPRRPAQARLAPAKIAAGATASLPGHMAQGMQSLARAVASSGLTEEASHTSLRASAVR